MSSTVRSDRSQVSACKITSRFTAINRTSHWLLEVALLAHQSLAVGTRDEAAGAAPRAAEPRHGSGILLRHHPAGLDDIGGVEAAVEDGQRTPRESVGRIDREDPPDVIALLDRVVGNLGEVTPGLHARLERRTGQQKLLEKEPRLVAAVRLGCGDAAHEQISADFVRLGRLESDACSSLRIFHWLYFANIPANVRINHADLHIGVPTKSFRASGDVDDSIAHMQWLSIADRAISRGASEWYQAVVGRSGPMSASTKHRWLYAVRATCPRRCRGGALPVRFRAFVRSQT
jgi:hypothetical protein